jgi:hypothetical protein
MHLKINDNTTFKEIQEAFSNFYPYLLLEFYTRGHKKYEGSLDIDLVYPGKTIGDVKKTHVSGILEILPHDTAAQLEQELQMRFGLPAQVFWKDNDVWRETTGMDDFTLKELNEFGRNATDEYITSEQEEGMEEQEDRPEKLM